MTNNITYIAVEGVIGAGKTTLASALAERLNARLVLENFSDNPFLGKFYQDQRRYAFRTQLFFLLERYMQLVELNQKDLFHKYIVSDYIFEKDKIFAYLNLSDEELKIYESIVEGLEKNILNPDLVIYLQCSTEKLMDNITRRNREIERGISFEYIDNLNDAYNYFFSRYKGSRILIVNSEQADFISNQADIENLIGEIFNPEIPAVKYFNPSIRKVAE
jgi:deoxyguanosine kinase